MKSLPVGTAYAVWMGIGAAGTVIFGIFLFGESTNPWRLLSVGLILLGVIGLKITST
jgi:quaternary ammonium compound-resistance protein SugE